MKLPDESDLILIGTSSCDPVTIGGTALPLLFGRRYYSLKVGSRLVFIVVHDCHLQAIIHHYRDYHLTLSSLILLPRNLLSIYYKV